MKLISLKTIDGQVATIKSKKGVELLDTHWFKIVSEDGTISHFNPDCVIWTTQEDVSENIP